jgi:hypothetical protein
MDTINAEIMSKMSATMTLGIVQYLKAEDAAGRFYYRGLVAGITASMFECGLITAEEYVNLDFTRAFRDVRNR